MPALCAPLTLPGASTTLQDAAFEVPYSMQQMQLYLKYARAHKPELTALVRCCPPCASSPRLWCSLQSLQPRVHGQLTGVRMQQKL
jgi:hypothetical protein